MRSQSFSRSFPVACILVGVAFSLACAPMRGSDRAGHRAQHDAARDLFMEEDPGLESFARDLGAPVHYFPMMFDETVRFSAEIQEGLASMGPSVAFAGHLRDIRRAGSEYEVVLSGPFGTHVLELRAARTQLESVLGAHDRAHEERYYVVASIVEVSRPILEVIREEETLRLEAGSIVPPTVYRGSLKAIAKAQ